MLKVFQILMTSKALDKVHDSPFAGGTPHNNHIFILADDGCVGHGFFLIAQNGAQGYPVRSDESKGKGLMLRSGYPTEPPQIQIKFAGSLPESSRHADRDG